MLLEEWRLCCNPRKDVTVFVGFSKSFSRSAELNPNPLHSYPRYGSESAELIVTYWLLAA